MDIQQVSINEFHQKHPLSDQDMVGFYFSQNPNIELSKKTMDFFIPEIRFNFKKHFLYTLTKDEAEDYEDLGNDFWDDWGYDSAKDFDFTLLNISDNDEEDIYLKYINHDLSVIPVGENTFSISLNAVYKLTGYELDSVLKNIDLSPFIQYSQEKEVLGFFDREDKYFLNSVINQPLLYLYLKNKIFELIFKPTDKKRVYLMNGFAFEKYSNGFEDCFEIPDFINDPVNSIYSQTTIFTKNKSSRIDINPSSL